MKRMFRSVSRALAIVAMTGVLVSPMLVSEAMAGPYNGGSCGGNPAGSGLCSTSSDCTNGCTCVTGLCQVPEMSDYLAMAYLVVASGMVYYFRRGAYAQLKLQADSIG